MKARAEFWTRRFRRVRSRSHLDRGRAVPRHRFEVRARAKLEPLRRARPDRPDSAAGIFARSRGRKNQMRVAIDEAGHHHASGCVDLDGFTRLLQILQAAAWSHLHHNAVAYQNRAVRDYTKFS